MTQTEILEGNKLIAEFMGYFISYYSNEFDMVNVNGKMKYLSSWAKYHSNWNWLMPVFDRISKILLNPRSSNPSWTDYHELRTFSQRVGVRINGCPLYKGETLIESAWIAVVNFIQSYNTDSNMM